MGNLAVDVMWRPSIGIDRRARGAHADLWEDLFLSLSSAFSRSLLHHPTACFHILTHALFSFYPTDNIDLFPVPLDSADCTPPTDTSLQRRVFLLLLETCRFWASPPRL